MKKSAKRLTLSRETVRNLGAGDLRKAAGATCWSASCPEGPGYCPDETDASAGGCVSGNLC